MRFHRPVAMGITAILVVAMPGGLGAVAQSPSESPEPTAATTCPAMTEARSPLPESGAVLLQAFGAQNPAFPHPDAAFTGRFHPGEDWAYPGNQGGAPIVAIGNGVVIASGSIGAGGRGGIVVVEHTGPFTVPASTWMRAGATRRRSWTPS